MNFNREPVISVGVLKDKKIAFELYGNFKVSGFKKNFSGIFSAEVIDNKVVCKQNSETISNDNALVFEPEDPLSESFLIRDVIIGINFHWQRKEKQRFNHTLKLFKKGNEVVVINILPLERYIVSVISSEMSAKSSKESLKAHAVVSRSWVLAQLEKIKPKKGTDKVESLSKTKDELIRWYGREQHQNYDVCADDHCQRFQGVTKVTSENARNAVLETRGVVLLSNKKICDTRYSKSCGGVTEDFANVWEPNELPYLQSVVDYKYPPENFKLDLKNETNAKVWITGNPPSFCNTIDKVILSQIMTDYDKETVNFYRWKVEYTQDELSKIVKEKSGIEFGLITDLIPVERGSSGRLIKLKIVGINKSLTIGKELEIRKVLSLNHLYSSAFVINKTYKKDGQLEKFILTGAGWGHGVGLCQVGSAVMAEKGYQFDEILMHYFSNAIIKKIYN